MARADQQASRVEYLLQRLCDERLEEREAVELSELLADSEASRRRYVEVVQMCATLADWAQPASAGAAPVEVPQETPVTAINGHANGHATPFYEAMNAGANGASHAKNGAATPKQSKVAASKNRYYLPTLAAVAALLLLSTSFLAWRNFGSDVRDSKVATNDDTTNDNVATGDESAPRLWQNAPAGSFVARVVEVTADAQWDDAHQPREFLMRLRAGDRLHLRSGLAQLEFYSGARIILQGPSRFTPTGPAGGKLESGRLTGKVDVGKFWLTTPTAKVIDLGTEFGVTVGPTSNTDVCVFDGEVEVRPGASERARQQSSESYNLTRGMSVRVAPTGKVSDGMYAGVDYEVYTRSFPLPAGLDPGELDLVDIVCGGNGQTARLAAAIDPLTGQWDRRPWSNALGPGTRHGDRLFHEAGWHPFIDGTFVPNQYGEAFQVDSRGGTITLPKDRGHYTWGPIWARRAVRTSPQLDKSVEFWGTETNAAITDRLTRCRLGAIGIHASVGITFDLQSIGTNHLGQIRSVKGVLTNLENSKIHNPEWANSNPPPTADFLVFVDGKKRYEVLDFGHNVAGEPFAIELLPSDRFLTFVTTDGGNSNRYDHMVLIDPVLEIDARVEQDTQ